MVVHPASTALVSQQAKDGWESLTLFLLPGLEAMQEGGLSGHQTLKILSPSPKPCTAEVNVVSNCFLHKHVTSKNCSVDLPSSVFTQA